MDITFLPDTGDNGVALLHSPPGTAQWMDEYTHLSFMCPCGCGSLAGVNFKPKHPHGWNWDGNIEKPTVTPSILVTHEHLDTKQWHGYLTAGKWVTC